MSVNVQQRIQSNSLEEEAPSKEPLLPKASGGPSATDPQVLTIDLDSEDLRFLWSPPTLFQDWDQDYEERSSAWFELFVDLILVAACSNIADGFKENLTSEGLARFVLQMLVYQSAWVQYVAYTSRFRDDSLVHSALLFVYIAGAAGMVVHAGGFNEGEIVGFSAGFIVLKGALSIMYMQVYASIPRARVMTGLLLGEGALSITQTSLAVAFPDHGTLPYWMWGANLINEQVFHMVFGFSCGRQILPINIDHITDRMGCFVMVVLGESVVSEAISYRSLAPEARTAKYYGAALLGFMMTFGLALSFFHLQPRRERHAYRLSRYRGLLLSNVQKALAVSLLAVGVGIKFAMAAVVGGGEEDGAGKAWDGLAVPEHGTCHEAHLMSYLQAWVLLGALSCVMASLMGMRLAHYGGIEPRSTDRPGVWRLKMVQWALIVLHPVPPLVAAGVLTGGDTSDECGGEAGGTDPLVVLGVGAACAVGAALAESAVTHILKDTVLVAQAERAGTGHRSGDLIAEWIMGGGERLAVVGGGEEGGVQDSTDAAGAGAAGQMSPLDGQETER